MGAAIVSSYNTVVFLSRWLPVAATVVIHSLLGLRGGPSSRVGGYSAQSNLVCSLPPPTELDGPTLLLLFGDERG